MWLNRVWLRCFGCCLLIGFSDGLGLFSAGHLGSSGFIHHEDPWERETCSLCTCRENNRQRFSNDSFFWHKPKPDTKISSSDNSLGLPWLAKVLIWVDDEPCMWCRKHFWQDFKAIHARMIQQSIWDEGWKHATTPNWHVSAQQTKTQQQTYLTVTREKPAASQKFWSDH